MNSMLRKHARKRMADKHYFKIILNKLAFSISSSQKNMFQTDRMRVQRLKNLSLDIYVN